MQRHLSTLLVGHDEKFGDLAAAWGQRLEKANPAGLIIAGGVWWAPTASLSPIEISKRPASGWRGSLVTLKGGASDRAGRLIAGTSNAEED